MNLVDVHCHLNHELLKPQLDAVLKRAEKAGVKSIILSGVNPEGNIDVLELAKKHPLIKASLGIYPIEAIGLGSDETGLPEHDGKINLEEQFKFIEGNISDVVAIGEVGMDFHWASKDTYDEQAANFRRIIQFAIKVNKPIVIHSRKAEEETLKLLEENNAKKVIMHCFSGNKELTDKAIELNYYFTVPCSVTKNKTFRKLAKRIPLNKLLTETDAPYLSPREEPNEPAFIKDSIKKIAEIKDLDEQETANLIFSNYQNIFL